jgi:glycerophosphoryl diester phosphodiesterase
VPASWPDWAGGGRARASLAAMPPLKVGHKGAAELAAGNTIASFEAARAAGVDMIEFDVLSEHRDGSGRLLLAHDYEDLASRTPITLEEALAHLAGETYARIALDVDVKLPGYAPRVAQALRVAGLVERSLVSSMFPEDLDVIRATEPALRRGWSVPRVRRDYTNDTLTLLPALAVLQVMRRRLPAQARRAIRSGRVHAIMAHWRMVTSALAATVAGAGGELYVWTVDDPERVRRLSAMPVTGIITNDPRIFSVSAEGRPLAAELGAS